ncbi:MAG: transcription elongation factor GreA [Candidatus Saccharibacteria bacterium]|nr:transcription elongation factor GreA [Candidatus Saccharibacteria bacterium]
MSMDKTYHITAQGKQELEAELQQLKGRRGEVADKIAAARDFGDLSENAEYDAAREEQGLLETRIAEIEEILQKAQIIDAGGSAVVVLGSTVELTAGTKTVTYTVVGPVEADPLEGKISNESPIGQALMGKSVGDTVTITTPKGELTYTIAALR